ncbi:MAG: DUF5668 domain-containing protein [Pseudomonadota bacterium]
MNKNPYGDWRKQLAWGLILIAVGVSMFLQKMDLIDFYSLWHYWPLFIVAAGAIKMITYSRASEFTSGLWTVLVGLWLHAVFEHLFGLTFRNSWPLVIIACGAVMIIKPLIKDRAEANEELAHEK